MRKILPILLVSVVIMFAAEEIWMGPQSSTSKKPSSQSISTNKNKQIGLNQNTVIQGGDKYRTLGAGGPDAFGYRWIDNDTTAPNTPTFQWIDISAVGTLVTGLGDDNVVGPFNIGFNFPYYWYRVSSFYIGSNGYIAFGDNVLEAAPFPNLPNAARPNNVVAPLMSDLDFSEGTPYCYYWTNATADTCIISYLSVPWWNVPTSNCSLQIILSKPDSSITFQYKRIIGTPQGGWTGTNNTTGIENILGTVGLSYLNGANPSHNALHNDLAVKFYPPEATTYEARDVSIWNAMNENSGGVFLLNTQAHTLWANVQNSGNQTVTSCSVFCRVLNDLNQIVYSDTVEIALMTPGQQDSVVFTPQWTPTVTGVYRSFFRAKILNDIMVGNDSVVIETRVVTYPTELMYDDGDVDTRSSWQGWGGGYGAKFTPPIYPCRITSAKAHLSISRTTPIICTIYVFAADGPGGIPGTVLGKRGITISSNTPKWYYLQLDQTITSGSFFVGIISSDSAEPSYSMDTDAPISGQTWEYTGVWAPYRDKLDDDVMMRALIGFEPLNNDASVEELIAPTAMVAPGAIITPRALIRNWGIVNQSNIPVVMKIDSAGTNIYTGSASISLDAGDEDFVNFSPQWTAGPVNNGYDITVYTNLATDENRANDTIHGLTSSFVVVRNYYANFRGVQPLIDGNVEFLEWADAVKNDVSDIQGYGTGIPHRPGSAYLWVKHDSTTVYFAATMPYATTANDRDQIGLYLDENRSGTWASDSSEGNFWVVNYETGGVDSLIYRSLLPTSPLTTWRYGSVTDAQISCNLNNGYMHFECAIPKSTAKQHLNANPVRDTMRFWMFSADQPDGDYFGWWPQDMASGSWTNPMVYGLLFFRDRYYDVGITEIIQPTGTQYVGYPVTPKVVVKNYGLATTTFPVILALTEQKQEYLDTTLISLGLAEEDTVEFDVFPASYAALYQVEAKVEMPGDASAGNNIRNTSFIVEDLPLGIWSKRADILSGVSGKGVKDGGSMVAVGTNLYAFRGNKSDEFYKYSIGTWTKMCSIPYGKKPTDSLAINKKKVGKGAALCYDGLNTIYATKGNGTREFWAYNMTANSWTAKAFVSVPKGLKGGTSILYKGGKVYLLAGSQKAADPTNFYSYDIAANTWASLILAPLTPNGKVYKDGSCLAELDGKIYALKGKDKHNYLWTYTIDPAGWSTVIDTIPLVHAPYSTKKTKVGDGGAMTVAYGKIYAIKGGGKQDFWKYTPGTPGVWSGLESIPFGTLGKKGAPKTGAALAFAYDSIYLLKGNNNLEFWKYGPVVAKGNFASITPITQTAVMAEPTKLIRFTFDVHPNPFNNLTTVRYTVPVSSKVSLKLYNATGSLIETLNDSYLIAGVHTTTLSTANIAKGVYFLRYEDTTNRKEIKLIVQ